MKDDVGHVTQVCLVPEYRRPGHRRNLIACTYNSLRSRNFNLLSLTVTEMNHRAVDLYRRLGFDGDERVRCVCVGRVEGGCQWPVVSWRYYGRAKFSEQREQHSRNGYSRRPGSSQTDNWQPIH